MSFGKDVADPQGGRPDPNEEEENQQHNVPHLGVFTGPEV